MEFETEIPQQWFDPSFTFKYATVLTCRTIAIYKNIICKLLQAAALPFGLSIMLSPGCATHNLLSLQILQALLVSSPSINAEITIRVNSEARKNKLLFGGQVKKIYKYGKPLKSMIDTKKVHERRKTISKTVFSLPEYVICVYCLTVKAEGKTYSMTCNTQYNFCTGTLDL